MPATSIELHVDGMHCTSCAMAIERQLSEFGALEVHVNFARSTVELQLPENISIEAIKQQVKKLGYQVRTEQAPRWSREERLFAICLVFTVPLMLHMVSSAGWLHDPIVQLLLTLPIFIIGVSYFGRSALASLRAGIANMDLLIIGGSTAAFVYSVIGTIGGLGHNYQFYETTATIITAVLLGNVIERRSVKKTATAIEELSSLTPIKALKVIANNQGQDSTVEIDVNDLQIGDVVQINSGDRLPCDALIISGTALINEAMLTGESAMQSRKEGDAVIGGTVVTDGTIRARVTATGESSTLARIIQLVQSALHSRPSLQQLGDRVSSIFVPAVIIFAIATFVGSFLLLDLTFNESLLRTIAVMVVACPCAMGLATPTAVMVGIGNAARSGILIRGGRTLEQLAAVRRMLFDKTGTLTSAQLNVGELKTFNNYNREKAIAMLKALENTSSHPIAKAIRGAWPEITPIKMRECNEIRGVGVDALSTSGEKIMLRAVSHSDAVNLQGSDIILEVDNQPVAAISISGELRSGAKAAIAALRNFAIEPIMVTGDNQRRAEEIGKQLGISAIYAKQSPAAKMGLIDRFQSASTPCAFIGDGINDAPVLARAAVGISLTDASEIAIQSAQVIILGQDLRLLPKAVEIARTTVLTIKQNLFWAFFYNILMLPIAAAGYLTPTIAALSMIFSDVIVIGNSLRRRFI